MTTETTEPTSRKAQVVHLSRRARSAAAGPRGRRRRGPASRALEPTATRDAVALLEEQGASRVQELLPIRYGRMLVSPFTFFRGARTGHGERPVARAATPV